MKKRIGLIALALLAASFTSSRLAQAEEEQAAGAARVSLVHGDVSTQRGDSGDWVATTVNAPLVRGDKISTGARSRTELQLDYANILRLDQRSEAKIADLSRTRIQVQLAQGTMNFTVFKDAEAEVEIDTPNVAVHPLGEGVYRIQVISSAETEVTVRKGQAEVSTPQGNTTVEKNQLITIQGTENPQYQVAKALPHDEWDNWNRDRDAVIRDAESWRHTNHYYTGAQDLDRYGRWVHAPGYDWVWSPYVDAGWAPYRDGRWVWEPDWGWTWVSYEPWGWAPYHYGRWFLWDGGWSWWPGFVTTSFVPVWSPAWVSFIGFGFGRHSFGFGLGFGFSSIGWCPLGPFDPFFPWWGFGNRFNFVNITNITNVTNITNITNVPGSNFQSIMTNARVRGAITKVSTDDFVRGRILHNNRPVDVATLRQGQVVKGALPAVPTHESLRPVDRPVRQASIPAQDHGARSFFTRREPPAGPRPFAERAAEIRQMVERQNPLKTANPAGTLPERNFNPTAGAQGAQRSPVATPLNDDRAWRRFGPSGTKENARTGGVTPGTGSGQFGARPMGAAGQQGNSTPAQKPPLTEQQDRSGWHRFGSPASGPAPARQMPREDESQRARTARPAPESDRSGWQSFSRGSDASIGRRSAPPVSAPQERGTRGEPSEFRPRPAPQADRGENGTWREFRPQPKPAPRNEPGNDSGNWGGRREPNTVVPRNESASPGWNRFTPRPESMPAPRERQSNGWGSESPRSRMNSPSASPAPGGYNRPPLEMRRPIVSESAPRSYGGGAWGGGSRPVQNNGGGTWGGGGHAVQSRGQGGSQGSSRPSDGHGRGKN